MKKIQEAIGRFFSLFRDSPTYGRDQASLLSGFTVGSIALLLNAAVLMAVLPLMLDPNDRDFRQLTQHLEFGQLLTLILLGGAAASATLIVPLRLCTVFWGPRMGRYFDQIVLSGISPMRFMIGKVTSQNLFLALTLFLLIPYAVLALALGGVQPVVFLACLVLVWIYCITLAMVTLCLSLYLNEVLAAIIVGVAAAWMAGLGSVPFPLSLNPCVITPFPALLQPIWDVVYDGNGQYAAEFWPTFAACAAGMSVLTGLAFVGIYFGPLYGIIRDNSTFGEVVRTGDATKKRRFRLRQHIQRPSELAFFYENRSNTLRRHEGLIRWGSWFVGLTFLLTICTGLRWFLWTSLTESNQSGSMQGFFSYGFHVSGLMVHGFAMAFAVFIFSHSRNTTFQKIPFLFGRAFEVARVDTAAFILFTIISAATCVGLPYLFEQYAADHNGHTVFFTGNLSQYYRQPIDFHRVAWEGTLALTICGICTYLLHRWLCLSSWLKAVPFVTVSLLYGALICGGFMVPAVLIQEFRELQNIPWLTEMAPQAALASPVVVMLGLFRELNGSNGIPQTGNFSLFYIVHAVLAICCLWLIRRQSRLLRAAYLVTPFNKTKASTRAAKKIVAVDADDHTPVVEEA